MSSSLHHSFILLLPLLVSEDPSAFSWADDPITIRQILEEPHTYHLHHVTLRGTVHDIVSLDPYKRADETVCYGAYLFRLEDETASIAVAVLGLCGTPVARDPDVEEGEQVEVGATIHAPGHHGYHLNSSDLQVVADQEGSVQAIADYIRPIVE